MYKCQKVHLKFQVLIKVVISLTILSLNYLVFGICTFVPFAISVKIGATSVAIYSEIAIIIVPTMTEFIVGAARGNIIHSVIVGTIMIAISLYIATDVAPIFTDMACCTNNKRDNKWYSC
jgi:hypothetical protein